MKYTVTVRKVSETEPGAFVLLNQYDPDAWFALIDTGVDTNEDVEVYAVYADGNLDGFLNNSPGVIEYE